MRNDERLTQQRTSERVRPVGLRWMACLLGTVAITAGWTKTGGTAPPFGVSVNAAPAAYLGMPARGDDKMPPLLSQTGVFTDIRTVTPTPGMIPYELIVPFWSDGAQKDRWVAIPKGHIAFSPTGEWVFPAGTVFAKTFYLPTDAADGSVRRRLETRLLVRDSEGGVYGVDYKWRADGSDADLLEGGQTEDIAIKTGDGSIHPQTWYYPSRQDCLTCHTARAGGVLGLKARQMNRTMRYPSGVTDNELRTWNHLGLFDRDLSDGELASIPSLAAADDGTRSLEDRGRSYLDANCSHCHRPGGTVANFDARFETPLEKQALIDGPILINEGIDKPRVIAPHDIWRSILYMRANTNGDIRMPPLARETIDQKGVQLLAQWIDSMPGRTVLAPPVMSPAGGVFKSPVTVSLDDAEPGADIHYTLDGSVPGTSDPRYERPIKVDGSVVLRARAFKDGFTRSITEQQIFIVGQ